MSAKQITNSSYIRMIPGNMYCFTSRTAGSFFMWAKEKGTFYNGDCFDNLPKRNENYPIGEVDSTKPWMFIKQSLTEPYTYKILQGDQAGWVNIYPGTFEEVEEN